MLDRMLLQQFVQAVRNVIEDSRVNRPSDYADLLIIENILPQIEAYAIFGGDSFTW